LDTFAVQKDDIIILSSDGLWDVIKTDQLQEIMERNTDKVKEFSRLILFTSFYFIL
jgi:serine/threonine protein phosphatase PrpC